MFHCESCGVQIASEEAYQTHSCEGNAIVCPNCHLGFGSWDSFQEHERLNHSWNVRGHLGPQVSPTNESSDASQDCNVNTSRRNKFQHLLSGHDMLMESSHWDTTTHNVIRPAVENLLDLQDDETNEAQVANLESKQSITSGSLKTFLRNCDFDHAMRDRKPDQALNKPALPEGACNSGPSSPSRRIHISERGCWCSLDSSLSKPVSTMGYRIVCFQCEAGFNTIIGLQHHQMTENHNYCGLCHAYFADGTLLDKHKDVAHNFKCSTCASVSASVEELWAHQQATNHSFCGVCCCYFRDESIQRKHNLAYHMRIPCPTCKRVFQTQQELEQHQRAIQHCYCDQCDEIMNSQSSFESHVATSHIYKCMAVQCLFSAAKLQSLKDHQKQEKHNFCSPCNRSFTDGLALTNHSKTEKHLRKARSEQSGNNQVSGRNAHGAVDLNRCRGIL
ncbi:C2H2-type domain-containing protein [Trichophyton interdigitale]|uniref:C2H2-type domain-containing protein n=1 Tax=Trichophyton interdigitale TaxID=101480 RepID=A0A9P4YK51_9EURO|nr:C2H2-type domain-containing protein [Trichophyton interdigitale]KAF3897673.1 C2H2-type domain-containing protein [Trichophyton interdigitale]KAG8208092.1 C2H2-type domain-containing protein [Trichophyton interdigitale]